MRTGPALAVDVVLVLVFVLIGRRTHDDPLSLAGLARTAWPFLAGLALTWTLIALRWRGPGDAGPARLARSSLGRPSQPLPASPGPRSPRRHPASLATGVTVWMATVAVGMLLRAASGQGTAPSFVAVATLVLGAFLVGWRVVARQFRRDASSSSSAA
ncbi:DUF3054 domain-containing protein [Jiangella sp. DSM 45060]|uniref:DUF3054 domain-containing protein n=1 Tax=Jiangella sp. DSM 45060 TaxID=1798224 RepID=UPI00087D2A7E|nr:DUF3054 domain-containing protein [Jiangella sp. DSM 45060]SDT68533.1 Protein of unknown function [Jiangella sp. DSM 45060]